MNEKELCRSVLTFDKTKFRKEMIFIGICFDFAPLMALLCFLNFSLRGVVILLGIGLILFFVLMLITELVCNYRKSICMVVTDKRIYGCVSSKKQVDLPLDQISAVALFKKNALAVSTPSGRVVFRGIGNRDDLYYTINGLLAERQEKKTIQQEPTISNADELKKYKELLDDGVITQEEFDAKKKQLLDL